MPYGYLLDFHKAGEKLMKCRSKVKRGPVSKTKLDKLKDQLCAISDEEEYLEAELSEESCDDDSSNGTDLDDCEDIEWLFLDGQDSNLKKIQETNDVSDGEVEDYNRDGYTINGLHWESNGSIEKESDKKMPPRDTTIKPECQNFFKTPIDSVMAIFPIVFWEIIMKESNRYAEFKLKRGNVKRPNLIAGHKWKPLTLHDVMTFFGISIYALLYPQTGH
jgi:hypothetical protein